MATTSIPRLSRPDRSMFAAFQVENGEDEAG
jgi:hypothetical protein